MSDLEITVSLLTVLVWTQCFLNEWPDNETFSQFSIIMLNMLASLVCTSCINGVVSKETVVLRRWGSCIQKFGFINGVDNVN